MQFFTKEQADDLDFITKIVSDYTYVNSIDKKFGRDGTNGFTYDINNKIIVKFAKNNKTKDKITKENNILNLIKGKTTSIIPEPVLYNDKHFFMMYEKIPGEVAEQEYIDSLPVKKQEQFHYDIALFAYQLHQMTDIILNSTKIGPWDRSGRNYSPNEIITAMKDCNEFEISDIKFAENFYNRFDPYQESCLKRFCHMDMLAKNIAFDKNKQKIAGFYDFGEVSYDDIHLDFEQMSISFNMNTIRKIIIQYEKLSGIKIDLEKVWDYHMHLYFAAFVIGWDKADKIKEKIVFRQNIH